MFEKLTKVNQVWLADFAYLTRRFDSARRSKSKFNHTYIPQKRGEYFQKRGIRPNASNYPKWSRYAFKGNGKHIDKIRIYPNPVFMFAIQDAYSRFIIHACLKECPKEFVGTMPHWFKLDDCFKEAFEYQKSLKRFGIPFEFILDSMIYSDYLKKLETKSLIQKQVTASNHYLLSPLDAFFGRLFYEMRTDLTQKNLSNYIDYYNYERPHSSLNGKTPADYFFSSNVFW